MNKITANDLQVTDLRASQRSLTFYGCKFEMSNADLIGFIADCAQDLPFVPNRFGYLPEGKSSRPRQRKIKDGAAILKIEIPDLPRTTALRTELILDGDYSQSIGGLSYSRGSMKLSLHFLEAHFPLGLAIEMSRKITNFLDPVYGFSCLFAGATSAAFVPGGIGVLGGPPSETRLAETRLADRISDERVTSKSRSDDFILDVFEANFLNEQQLKRPIEASTLGPSESVPLGEWIETCAVGRLEKGPFGRLTYWHLRQSERDVARKALRLPS